MSRSIDVRFIHEDTGLEFGKTYGGRYFIAFSPFPPTIKSKAKWIGLAPETEGVARSLASFFTQIADKMKSDQENKK